MARYEVVHAYRSSRDGQQYGPWQPGEFVELSVADAEWVNRDSPGCLIAPPGEDPVRQKSPGPNRQHRGASNRGA